MSEKKRKRNSEHGSERPQKKVAFEAQPDLVKVCHVPVESEWAPILASAPGLTVSKISLKPYKKTQTKNGRTSSEFLLHASPHPRLNYTAREEEPGAIENLKRHYIGIYDPINGKLQLVEARKVAIRGSASSKETDGSESDKADSSPHPISTRSALGLAFGTKKSQKAIRARTENAIISSPTKSPKPSQSSPSRPALDPAASIILESMAASTISMPSREEMQLAADDAKPIPKPNLQAEVPADVYPLEQLVGLETMRILPVKDWMDKIRSGEDIITKSRFVSHRVRQVVKSEDVRKIKALKYLLVLVEWYLCIKLSGHNIRKLPNKKEIAQAMKEVDTEILESLTARFTEERHLNKWHTNNLLTHICALTLVIDNFSTDTHDLCADLRLEQKELTALFKELGCRILPIPDSQRASLGLSKKDASSHPHARLVLPLVFPTLRTIAKRRK